jgi:hypothetical protein
MNYGMLKFLYAIILIREGAIMPDTNFQPIFDYIDQNNQVLEENIMVKVRAELRDMKSNIANLVTDVKSIKDELLVSNHRTTRLEHWAKPVGDKVGIPIDL